MGAPGTIAKLNVSPIFPTLHIFSATVLLSSPHLTTIRLEISLITGGLAALVRQSEVRGTIGS